MFKLGSWRLDIKSRISYGFQLIFTKRRFTSIQNRCFLFFDLKPTPNSYLYVCAYIHRVIRRVHLSTEVTHLNLNHPGCFSEI